jgi:Tol biopolymer transport system component
VISINDENGRRPEDGRSYLASYDFETRELSRYTCCNTSDGYHPNASPDGRWISIDWPGLKIGGKHAIHLVDVSRDMLVPLCATDTTWHLPSTGAHTGLDRAGKSEWLHPNPIWSPDSRYIIFATDRKTEITQVYAVDLDSLGLWKGR